MAPRKGVRSLVLLCCEKVPGLVRTDVTRLTSHLVAAWWSQKTRGEKRKWNFVNRDKVVLASGRVREMEEEVVGQGEMEFEFSNEDLLACILKNDWYNEQVTRKHLDEPSAPFVQTVFYKFLVGVGYSETLLNTNQSEFCILEELGEHAGNG